MWFQTSKSTYMSIVAGEFFADHWLALSIPILILTAAGFWYNAAFFMVLLIVACLIIPLLMMVLYYSYSLTDEAIAAIRPHRVETTPQGDVILTFKPDLETGREYPAFVVKSDQISSSEINGDNLILKLKDKPYRYVILPLSFQPHFSIHNL